MCVVFFFNKEKILSLLKTKKLNFSSGLCCQLLLKLVCPSSLGCTAEAAVLAGKQGIYDQVPVIDWL